MPRRASLEDNVGAINRSIAGPIDHIGRVRPGLNTQLIGRRTAIVFAQGSIETEIGSCSIAVVIKPKIGVALVVIIVCEGICIVFPPREVLAVPIPVQNLVVIGEISHAIGRDEEVITGVIILQLAIRRHANIIVVAEP